MNSTRRPSENPIFWGGSWPLDGRIFGGKALERAGEIDGRGQAARSPAGSGRARPTPAAAAAAAARFQAGTVGRKAGKLPGRGQGGQARPAALGT